MLAKLDAAEFEVCDCYDGVDAVIVNTCGFIDAAKEEAIENILDMAQLKSEGTVGKIIVTGCLAQRYKDEIFSAMPEVDAVIGIGANDDIAELVKSVIGPFARELLPAADWREAADYARVLVVSQDSRRLLQPLHLLRHSIYKGRLPQR